MSTSDSYGNVSWTEKVTLIVSLFFHMPLVVAWTLFTSPFHPVNRSKSWRRVVADKAFHHLTKELNVMQLQWLLGNTHDVYKAWIKKNALPAVVDELGEDSRLLWIGARRTDRIILYLHGGAYLLPLMDFAATFWKLTISELKNEGIDTGFAILNYTLVPTATFPTQLRQAVRALEYLFSSGVKPENIQIASDAGGANLAITLMSHILHPLDGVPHLKLTSPIRGVLLMAPWVSLSSSGGSLVLNDGNDIVGTKCLTEWGRLVLQYVPDLQRVYIEPMKAPISWFTGINTVVDRILITAGDAECLRDDVEVFAKRICNDHDKAEFVVQKNGIHNDPYFDQWGC